jgi:hypothetical protein
LNCEPDVLLEDLWVHGSSHPLPDETPPSCRYLPLRVLTWLRYDAHWLRQASDVQHPRGHRHNHRTEVVHFCPLSSSRLQPTTRSSMHFHRFGTDAFSGFFPFSAIIARRDQQGSSPAALRPQVFTTSRQNIRRERLAGLFHPAGTPRVMAFRVLPQHRSCTVSGHFAPAPSSVLHGFLLLRSGDSSHLTAPVLPGATSSTTTPDHRSGWFPS